MVSAQLFATGMLLEAHYRLWTVRTFSSPTSSSLLRNSDTHSSKHLATTLLYNVRLHTDTSLTGCLLKKAYQSSKRSNKPDVIRKQHMCKHSSPLARQLLQTGAVHLSLACIRSMASRSFSLCAGGRSWTPSIGIMTAAQCMCCERTKNPL